MKRSVAALVLLLPLVGCGGGGGGDEAQGAGPATANSPAPASTARQEPSPIPSPSPVGASNVAKYVDALMMSKPDEARKGLQLAAPGSVAYGYLEHLANVDEAAANAANSPVQTPSVTPVAGGGYKGCGDASDQSTCVTFDGFVVDPAGLVQDLTVNGEPVGPRLSVGDGTAITGKGGVQFTLLSSYRTAGQSLDIAVKVATSSNGVNVYASQSAYKDPTGKIKMPTYTDGVLELDANANTIVVYSYDGAAVGGQLTAKYADAKTYDVSSVVVKTGV